MGWYVSLSPRRVVCEKDGVGRMLDLFTVLFVPLFSLPQSNRFLNL
jgi:hypothetical protein